MVIKVINNIIELKKLSLTLLVFKAYPKIIELNFLFQLMKDQRLRMQAGYILVEMEQLI